MSAKNKTNPIRIITKFSNQHTSIKNIIKKYWHILKLDLIICPFVQDNPSFTIKWVKSIRDQLVMSEYLGGGSTQDPCKQPGTFKCGGCAYCQFMNTKPNIRLLNGEKYDSCQTFGVVYLLLCDCACFYVGKSSLEFWRRAYRHITSMKSCNPSLPLARHFSAIHAVNFKKNSFPILDRVHPVCVAVIGTTK